MESISQEAKDTILEVQVEAALQAFDLGPFDPVGPEISGWQAACRKCGQSVWVGQNGLMYSLLGERCANSP